MKIVYCHFFYTIFTQHNVLKQQIIVYLSYNLLINLLLKGFYYENENKRFKRGQRLDPNRS